MSKVATSQVVPAFRPTMPNAEHQYRIYIGKPDGFGVRGEDKTSAQPDYRSPTQCGEDVERGVLAVSSSFAGPSRYPVLKAVSALAILVLFGLSVDNLVPCCGSVIDSTSQSLPTVQHYARATTGSLLEVFQIYPPVLTVTPEGVLEITDGSSNATVDIVNSHRPSCQETLITYSFANSYGAPFIGDYVPPSCKFNRVTWNLTVTSAGRQFDRLGIVYLGDIEVFRTSTAEPTATGIEWTYLKVYWFTYRRKYVELTSPVAGHDKLPISAQRRPEDHLRFGQLD